MTVYSGVLNRPFRQASAFAKTSADKQGRHRAVSVKIENTPIFRLNLILLLIVAVTVAAYVFISNSLVFLGYMSNMKRSQLNQLNARLAADEQFRSSQGLRELQLFAQEAGMIEAQDTDSILEKDGFAVLP